MLLLLFAVDHNHPQRPLCGCPSESFSASVVSSCFPSLHLKSPLTVQYVKPPNLTLNSINLGSSGVNLNQNAFTVNINLGIRYAVPAEIAC